MGRNYNFSMHPAAIKTQIGVNGPISWRWLIALTAAAATLRFFHLNSDLWLDEIGTLVSYVRLPVGQIFRTYGSMNQHLLYSVLAHVSVGLFGESGWALRLPAAMLGLATIPALYYAARAITSEREALLAAAFLTFSYHHIWFSQDARGYSAMVFFSLLGTGFLLRAIPTGEPRYWIGYALSMAFGIVSLQNTAFVLLGQWICCWWALGWRRSGPLQLSVAAATMLSVAAHIFLLREMLHFMLHADRTALGWTKVGDLLPVVGNGLVAGLGLIGVAALACLGIVGWYSYWRQTRLLSGILIVPVLFNVILLIVLHIGAYPRSLLYELPFALLIAIRGLTVICRVMQIARFTTVLSLALVAAASVPLIRYYQVPKQDFTGALAYVNSRKGADDIVTSADLAAACYKRYYFPTITTVESVDDVEALRKTGRHIWVLYSFPREFQMRKPDLFRFLRSGMRHAATFPGTLGGGDLYVAESMPLR